MALKSTKARGFVYRPRTADQVKDRVSRKTSKFDSIFKSGFDTFRLKQGDNLFRYLPPTWDDADHYGYTIFVHYGIGPDNSSYLCPRKMLNKPCPVCESSKEAKDAGEAEEAKELQPTERIVSWVLDRDADDPERPMLFEQSWTQDRDVTSLCVNERTGEILMIDHPDKGYDVTVKRTGTGPKKTKYFGQSIARDDSPIHDSERVQDEILDFVKENPVPDTLNYYDYDYLQGVLSGTVAEKDEVLDKDVDEEDAPVQKGAKQRYEKDEDETPPRKTKVTRKEEVEDDVPFDKPTTRRGPRRDEEVDEEEEVEARPARGTTSTRSRVVEEENDDPPPRTTRRRAEPIDEEVDEEAEEFVERLNERPRSRQTASSSRGNGRTRVIEDEEEEDAAPPPRSASRSSTRVR